LKARYCEAQPIISKSTMNGAKSTVWMPYGIPRMAFIQINAACAYGMLRWFTPTRRCILKFTLMG